MEIALRSVVYITIALLSLAALLLIIPKIISAGEEQYCEASSFAGLFGGETSCQPKQESIKVNGEGDVVAMAISCNSKEIGLCFVAYKENGFSEATLRSALESAGLNFQVNVTSVDGKSVIKVEKVEGGVRIVG
ncbi:MAG: hypothetical protein QXL47_04335 [Candidatus Anstonellales archaeon]